MTKLREALNDLRYFVDNFKDQPGYIKIASRWHANHPSIDHFTLKKHKKGHFGYDDYESAEGNPFTLAARSADGEEIGRIEYEHRPDEETHIRWIEVPEAHLRKGIASRMMDELSALHPKEDIDTSGFTDDGAPFWESYFSRKKRT